MFRYFYSGSRQLTVFVILQLLLALGLLGFAVTASAQDTSPMASTVGTWPTWVLESGDALRLDEPPDDAATASEIEQLLDMAEQRSDEGLQQIAYWNSGPPAYRWNQIAQNTLLAQAMPGNMALRDLALLNVAIYDATVAAWDSKYTYNRPRPSEFEPTLTTAIPNPTSPSYPSEYAVTAGAASMILAWLFPDNADLYEQLAQEAMNSRLLAGVEYPSDVEARFELGRQVAEMVIERGTNFEFVGRVRHRRSKSSHSF